MLNRHLYRHRYRHRERARATRRRWWRHRVIPAPPRRSRGVAVRSSAVPERARPAHHPTHRAYPPHTAGRTYCQRCGSGRRRATGLVRSLGSASCRADPPCSRLGQADDTALLAGFVPKPVTVTESIALSPLASERAGRRNATQRQVW